MRAKPNFFFFFFDLELGLGLGLEVVDSSLALVEKDFRGEGRGKREKDLRGREKQRREKEGRYGYIATNLTPQP